MYRKYQSYEKIAHDDNNITAWTPEVLANETLAILIENMVASARVNRNYANKIMSQGETVNVPKLGAFKANRKNVNSDVKIQDVDDETVPVKLNQVIETSYMIRDKERSIAFSDLIAIHLRPAAIALATMLDRVVLGQYPRFIGNTVGGLGLMTATTAKGYILEAQAKALTLKLSQTDRTMIWTPDCQTAALGVDLFVGANTVGDDGTAMREGSLGRKFSFDNFTCQNMSTIISGPSTTASTINNVGGYAIGATSIVVASGSGMTAGEYLTVAGDMTPQRITNVATNTLTISPGLKRAVAHSAVVTVYDGIAVKNDYAAGYEELIELNASFASNKLQVGQAVAFGIASDLYTVVDVYPATNKILLDRPLDAAITTTQALNPFPIGNYNFGFSQDAMTLAIRPQALPMEGLAKAAVVMFNDIALRLVMTYDGRKQGHLITTDILCGISVLDANRGLVMLG